MNKKVTTFVLVGCFHSSLLAASLSVMEISNYIQQQDLKLKIQQEKVEEARALRTSVGSNFIPDVKLFGGIKSDEQKLEFKKEHFLGVRSELTLFDAGIKNLQNSYSEKQLQFSTLQKESVQVEQTKFLTLSLLEESALDEKINQTKNLEIKLRDVLARARGKKNAGILSETAVKEIEYGLLLNQQKISEFVDKKQLLIKEREWQLVLNEEVRLMENFDSAYAILIKNNSFETRLKLQQDVQLTELALQQVELQKERQWFKPEVKAFVEKGLTRKIDGEYLESDHQDRLVFGLNVEIPLLEAGGKNVLDFYAQKSAEKRLELESLYQNSIIAKEREFNTLKRQTHLRELQRKEEKLKQFDSLLILSWNDVVRGQKDINDYAEQLTDHLNEKLELIDQKLEQVKELF